MEFDLKLFKSACKDYLLDQVSESKYLRENVTIAENERFNEWLKNLSDEQAFNIVCESKYKVKAPVEVQHIRILQSQLSRFLVYGFLFVFPLTLVPALLYYLWEKHKDPCHRACLSSPQKQIFDQQRCQLECGIKAMDYVLSMIKSAKSKCSRYKNKERKERKCNRIADRQMKHWLKKKAKLQKRLDSLPHKRRLFT